jgi:alginate O-acetyltransferase complex protein AlgI
MKITYKEIFSVIIFAASYFYFICVSDYTVSIYTVLIACTILGVYKVFKFNKVAILVLAYLVLAITPFLTLTGQIGALTGFTRSGRGLPWLGISFASLSIAYLIYKDKLSVKELFLNALQPLRFSSGPVVNRTLRRSSINTARSQIYFGWLVLGAFFYSVLAAGLAPLLFLKTSTHALDVLVFGVVFEIYVYLNFAGISFMVYGLLNLVGVPVAINFNTPFASRDVMEYWRRWHLSFGAVLKEMFFNPLRKHLGLSVSIFVVFMASAMWHGVTLNFIAWGLFHGMAWITAYRVARLPWPRIGFALNIILLPVVIVFGRIVFSESDALILITKLNALFSLNWSNEAYVLNMVLDGKTTIIVAAVSLYLMTEVLFLNISHRYKYLRKKIFTITLLMIVALFGSTGLEGVYGTR